MRCYEKKSMPKDVWGNYEKNHHHGGYVGLLNQGATCYLNSLMQTLFMTPEFRNAVYNTPPPSGNSKWSSADDQSLLFQMQKLFAMLQTSERQAVETHQFTASLGTCWAFKPYEQRDSHELLRCIFDTLEEIWEAQGANHGGIRKSPIQQLYRGIVDDYIMCRICRKAEAKEVRHEPFLDIPLALKAVDGHTPLASIEESLHAYQTPQLLEDEPCEHCKCRGGLIKGFNIAEFPYILTFQLKRFDMNWKTMQRYKVNNRMEFPQFLDLNNHINRQFSTNEHDAGEPMDLGGDNTIWEEGGCSTATSSDTANIAQNGKMRGRGQQQNQLLYELFAVIAHSGSSTGGHYFSYIKNLEEDNWFCFNDSFVKPVTWKDHVASTFGRNGRDYNSSTNAYVLMYRKVDYERNERFMSTCEFPAHLEAIIKEENEKKKKWMSTNKLMRTIKPMKQKQNARNEKAYQQATQPIIEQREKKSTGVETKRRNTLTNVDIRIDMDGFEQISARDIVLSADKSDEKGQEQRQESYAQKHQQKERGGGNLQQGASNWAYQQAVQPTVVGNIVQHSSTPAKACEKAQHSQNEVPSAYRGDKRQQPQYDPSWVLVGRNRSYETLKRRQLMEQIERSQLILQKTTDVYNKLCCCQLEMRPTKRILSQAEEWRKEFAAYFEELSWVLSVGNDIFSSMYDTLLTKEGRQLFYDWLYLLRQNVKQEKINELLKSMLGCLTKMAENVPTEEVKAISIDICRNFKYYNSLNMLALHAQQKLFLKGEMIVKYELLQRALFLLLCSALGLKWRHFSSDFFKNSPWAYFLAMPSKLLKFNPLDEMRTAPSNGNLDFEYLRNQLYSLFHPNTTKGPPTFSIFNEHSVAFLLANSHADYPLPSLIPPP